MHAVRAQDEEHGERPTSLGELAHAIRKRRFIGRSALVNRFVAALDEGGAERILYLHGVGGIGKSALLRRYGELAIERGHRTTTVELARSDGRPDLGRHDARVVLIDDIDRRSSPPSFEPQELLADLPADALIVLAGRRPPNASWLSDPGWRELLATVPIDDLDESEISAMLDDLSVPQADRRALVRFAGGHPLAIRLVAEELRLRRLRAPASAASAWVPSHDLLRSLLDTLVGRPPTPEADTALRICAHVQHTTVGLLGEVIGARAAESSFAWLESLATTLDSGRGLRPTELLRRTVAHESQWRDPERYVDLHRALWHALGRRLEESAEENAPALAGELVYLHRYSAPHGLPGFAHDRRIITAQPYRPADRAAVLELAAREQGEKYAARVSYWLRHRPEDFALQFCPSGRLLSFIGWLRLGGRSEVAEAARDPVVDAVLTHLDESDACGAAEYIAIARFQSPAPDPDHFTTGDELLTSRMLAEPARHRSTLAATYLVLPDPVTHAQLLARFDYELVATVEVDGEPLGVLCHDWKEVPLDAHLERSLPPVGEIPIAPPEDAIAVPTLDIVEESIKQALRDWHDEAALAVNPLAGLDGVHGLRDRILTAVEALNTDPRRVRLHRVVAETYLRRPMTQEGAAAYLGLPFSTYRRHLKTAIQEIAERTWHDLGASAGR